LEEAIVMLRGFANATSSAEGDSDEVSIEDVL
jgi:hypothetical protein